MVYRGNGLKKKKKVERMKTQDSLQPGTLTQFTAESGRPPPPPPPSKKEEKSLRIRRTQDSLQHGPLTQFTAENGQKKKQKKSVRNEKDLGQFTARVADTGKSSAKWREPRVAGARALQTNKWFRSQRRSLLKEGLALGTGSAALKTTAANTHHTKLA